MRGLEAGIAAAIGYGAGQVAHLGHLNWPVFDIIIPTPSGGVSGPYTIDLNFIAAAAEVIDASIGEASREHAAYAIWMAEAHLIESGSAPGSIAYEWRQGPDGIKRAVGKVSYRLEVGPDGRQWITREVSYFER